MRQTGEKGTNEAQWFLCYFFSSSLSEEVDNCFFLSISAMSLLLRWSSADGVETISDIITTMNYEHNFFNLFYVSDVIPTQSHVTWKNSMSVPWNGSNVFIRQKNSVVALVPLCLWLWARFELAWTKFWPSCLVLTKHGQNHRSRCLGLA